MSEASRPKSTRPGYRAPALRPGARKFRIPALLPIVGAALVSAFALVSWWSLPGSDRWSSASILRWTLLGAAIAFAADALRRETANRRLASRLSDEQVLTTAYSNRVRDLSALVSTARTINSALELDEALRILLEEAMRHFQGSAGSIMLLDGAGYLQTAYAHGNDHAADARLRMGDSIAGHVALTREPLLIRGRPNPKRFRHLVEREEPIDSAMCVPLIHRDELLGVLNVNGGADRPFSDHDVQLLTVFAGHAAIAIGNARVFQAERERISDLADLNRSKADLISAVGRDLRAPITALNASLGLLRRIHGPESEEIVVDIERNLGRLSAGVTRLISEADLEHDERLGVFGSADLLSVATRVAQDFDGDGRRVLLELEDDCLVVGEEGLLQQVLWNLLDNAFKYGAPPVTIRVRQTEDQGLLSVIDRGPGVAPGDRDGIFQRFSHAVERGQQVMGLGLSIVHGIVSASGGRVWADDAEAGGAAFHVALPLARVAAITERAKEVHA